MNKFLHRYGTPLTAGLFTVSAVSGVALFFHWGSSPFHSMHEWLSMVLLAPFALHLWKNWKPLLAYARRKTLFVPLILSIAVAIPFAMMAGRGGGRAGNPAFRTVAMLTRVSLADLAPVYQSTPEALLLRVRQGGYKVNSTDESPASIANASAVAATEVLYSLMPASLTQDATKK